MIWFLIIVFVLVLIVAGWVIRNMIDATVLRCLRIRFYNEKSELVKDLTITTSFWKAVNMQRFGGSVVIVDMDTGRTLIVDSHGDLHWES
jgi:hypothetical protein